MNNPQEGSIHVMNKRYDTLHILQVYKYRILYIYILLYISLILQKHYTPARLAHDAQHRPQSFGKFRTKNEQQRMYSSKRCHIYVSSFEISVHEISGNLEPKNCGSPQNLRHFEPKFWKGSPKRFAAGLGP